MKNRINLYQTPLHPQLELVTVSSTLAVWGLCVVVLLVVFAGLQRVAIRDSQQLSSTQQKIQTQTLYLDSLKQALANRGQDPVLIEQLESLQIEYDDRQRLLMLLNDGQFANQRGFASLMADLATFHHQQVALTRIAATGQALQFEGKVSDPSVLPQWLGGLADAPYFTGAEFSAVSLFRDDNGLHFTLTSNPSSQRKGKTSE
ncbi:hypothetical protein [Aestuariibacter salexigens]|uniref:hypothetical protein n=1 Tax=Aestuariibacter salexigens TaxID=226010 RepID=UPI0004085FD5|nr:hypothetical protein [Aestuariibacter salexigens]